MLLENTVTTFLTSKEGRKLSSRRVLFHLPNRLKKYDVASKKIFQTVAPPISVALCPASLCIRECSFCSNTQRNRRNRINKVELSNQALINITEDLNRMGVCGVSIAGGGEPLTYAHEALVLLLTYKTPCFRLGIHTNGVLLDKILNTDILSSGNIQYINVSVVSANSSNYEDVCDTSPSQFDVVENNLKLALELKKKYSNFPTFGVKILVCRENYLNIVEIVRYFESLGIANILIRCVGNFEPGQDVELTETQYEYVSRAFKDQLKMSDDQINAVTGRVDTELPTPSRCWICALQCTAGVDPDGEVYLCSQWSRREYSIGNVNKMRLMDMWGSERHEQVAHTLNKKLLRKECTPLLCRHYYSNLAIDAYTQGLLENIPTNNLESDYNRFI